MVKSSSDLGKQTPLCPNLASDLLWDVSVNFGRPSKMVKITQIHFLCENDHLFPNALILGFLGLFWVENDPLVITRLPRGSIPVKNGLKIIFFVISEKLFFFLSQLFFFCRKILLVMFGRHDHSRALEPSYMGSPIDSELKFVISTLKDHYKIFFTLMKNAGRLNFLTRNFDDFFEKIC